MASRGHWGIAHHLNYADGAMDGLATSRLARPRAAFTRILTPILILPFALLVQWITDSGLL